MQNGLLLNGIRIVIPASLRAEILSKLHEGHLGITKCRERAKQSVWWSGLGKELTEMIDSCDTCACERTNSRETLLPSEFPSRPWSSVAADLFQMESKQYLVIVDYFSRFFEVAKLTSTTSEAVVEHFKSIFARHGIPEVVRSDNGPQFASEWFRVFAHDWGFSHVTSSPLFPQSNVEVERAVRTIKNLLKKSGDAYLALMAYQAAPLANGYSHSELLMGKKIRTPVPVVPSQLSPKWADFKTLEKKEQLYRQKQHQNYNRRHKEHDMVQLQPGNHVWIKDTLEKGTVVSTAGTPRAYLIETPQGILRRNRFHLSPTPTPPVSSRDLPESSSDVSVTTNGLSPSDVPDNPKIGPQVPPYKKRYPSRVKAPPGYLNYFVCS